MENIAFLISHCFCTFIFSLSIELSFAADTISPARFIRDGEILVSSNQSFELGFFSPGKSSNRYLGIWYKEIPETVVWVANRNNPITDTNGVLTIGDDGNLVLLNKTKTIMWSINLSRKVENPVAQLLDTGNLVLLDNVSGSTSESYLWQSFDHPSDTLLPGMKLGWDLKIGLERYLTSWRSMDDPSLGENAFRLDYNVLPQMFLFRGSMKIARTGPWNGVFLGGIPSEPNLYFEPVVVNNEDECSYRYESFNNPVVMLLKLNQSGMLQWEIWNGKISQWKVVYAAPEDICGNYGNCGANSLCSVDKTPICECLKGFTNKSEHNQTSSQGCVRSSTLDCEGGDGFVMVGGIKLPDLLDVSLHENMSLKECEAECTKNCTCEAYANSNKTGGGSGCLMWFGDLVDVRKLVEARGTQDIYIRVPASELVDATDGGDETNIERWKIIWIIIVPIMSLTVATLGLIFLYVRRKIKRKGENLLLFDLNMNLQGEHPELAKETKLGIGSRKEVKLPSFSFASVSAATDNFSTRNKLGEGGFGSVYKGTLLKGDEIAVKRLSKRSGQGWEEFKNEAVLIAQLQHKNLVRILGYCVEHGEKILIYEYLPNKSLDFFLFDPFKRNLIDWEKRVRIIHGISQGLLYLHEHSRLRIIHRDLKASNILLDEGMNPKISDFGMARIFGGNILQANTNRIVGTYGYMSPEYALEGLFSIKSDVFSFGVLLLEIISGKKNTGVYQTNSLNLLGYAWDMWRSGKGLELMDPVPEEASYKHMLLRYVNIALLCVQERAADRPNMSDVVSMLNNQTATLPSPERPAFTHLRSTVNLNSPISRAGSCSNNDITVTILEAR